MHRFIYISSCTSHSLHFIIWISFYASHFIYIIFYTSVSIHCVLFYTFELLLKLVAHWPTDWQTDRRTNGPTNGPIDRQTDRQCHVESCYWSNNKIIISSIIGEKRGGTLEQCSMKLFEVAHNFWKIIKVFYKL